jgi:hypothetical protein
MTAREGLRRMLSPPADVTKVDTGLRFTDILFGFVIRELFIRLQKWDILPGLVRWQLIVATTLVLGSWIGFRRSLNRSAYELKFFNLPLVRFALDQGMVVLYFRIAVLTLIDPTAHFDAGALVRDTLYTLTLIFTLYALWDLFGIWMATAGRDAPKYPRIGDGDKPSARARSDWEALMITLVALGMIASVYSLSSDRQLDARASEIVFIVATALLLLYRFAKEVRTSWRMP